MSEKSGIPALAFDQVFNKAAVEKYFEARLREGSNAARAIQLFLEEQKVRWPTRMVEIVSMTAKATFVLTEAEHGRMDAILVLETAVK